MLLYTFDKHKYCEYIFYFPWFLAAKFCFNAWNRRLSLSNYLSLHIHNQCMFFSYILNATWTYFLPDILNFTFLDGIWEDKNPMTIDIPEVNLLLIFLCPKFWLGAEIV